MQWRRNTRGPRAQPVRDRNCLNDGELRWKCIDVSATIGAGIMFQEDDQTTPYYEGCLTRSGIYGVAHRGLAATLSLNRTRLAKLQIALMLGSTMMAANPVPAPSDQWPLPFGAPMTRSPPRLSRQEASKSLLAPARKRQQAALWRCVLISEHAAVRT